MISSITPLDTIVVLQLSKDITKPCVQFSLMIFLRLAKVPSHTIHGFPTQRSYSAAH